MYDIDRFSYWNDPIVKIKRRGIYPLNDEGRALYYSKDSFVHHYLIQYYMLNILDDIYQLY